MFVGIDLAWSSSNVSGLAVVDDDGALVASGTAVRDDEIDAWLRTFARRSSVVAVDAPLVVTNPSGQRECERLVSQAFGKYNASCHSSNTGLAHLQVLRGAELAVRHGWTVNPTHHGSPNEPACIEVYPHPAMVGIFELGTVIPYKNRSGRPLEASREAFRELVRHMESLTNLRLPANERWRTLTEGVGSATSKAALKTIEDEIDAIFCAHLAWLWGTTEGALQIYGDPGDGYIVAPAPPTHPASGRAVRPSARRPVPFHSFEVAGRPATFATAHEAAWKAAVRAAAGAREVPEGARIGVQIDFRLAPSSRTSEQWDLDNLIKPTIDALDGVLGLRKMAGVPQVDDERVDEIRATKRPARDGEPAGASIAISLLPLE